MASGAEAAPVVQTVVLKVAIHCHGCKKKVRKVLRGIEGVQDVTVDASQHKVTVTGTVDADTLIKRLYKSGKKGVPWQCHPPANKTEPAPEAPQPAGDGGKDAAAAAAAADKKPEEAVKEPQGESSEEKKKPEQEVGAAEKKPEAESKGEEKVEAKKDGGDNEGADTKQAKGAAEPAKEAAASDDDEAKKSDKHKDGGKAEPAAMTTERSLPLAPAPKHAYEQEYRPPYYAPQPVLSYHAAQRSSSVSYFTPQAQPAYSTQQAHPHQAYYSAQQPQPQPAKQWSPSYLYMPYQHAAPEPYYQDYYGPPGMHASPMHDSSYRIFDDENPNSCSVM